MFTIDNDTNAMTIIKKDTASFDVALDNYNLETGDSVTFTISKQVEEEEPILQKTVTDFVDGIATVKLTKEDTNIEVGTYLYDIQIDTSDGRTDTVVGPAKFTVKGGVTY